MRRLECGVRKARIGVFSSVEGAPVAATGLTRVGEVEWLQEIHVLVGALGGITVLWMRLSKVLRDGAVREALQLKRIEDLEKRIGRGDDAFAEIRKDLGEVKEMLARLEKGQEAIDDRLRRVEENGRA